MTLHDALSRKVQQTDRSPRPATQAVGPKSKVERFAALQRKLGNRGASRWLMQLKQAQAPPVQRAALDNAEEEELQMKRNPHAVLQRAELQEEEELQMKRDPGGALQRAELPEEEELQMKRGGQAAAPRRPNGVPEHVMQKMESTFGTSFADVNIHVGNEASEVGALAFTRGSDIHFAPGQYDPESKGGQELLGHELAHVVQQREGRVAANGEVNGLPLNDDPGLEAEADRLGKKAAAEQ